MTLSPAMGLRDWFTSSPKEPKPAEREADDATASEDTQAFAALQNAKTEEALSLFEEDEPEEASQIALDAPYDASGADVEDLLTEGRREFHPPRRGVHRRCQRFGRPLPDRDRRGRRSRGGGL